jgi:hypothetical protein
MSIKLALLKSGEEVVADIKEIVNEDEKVVSFLFCNPYSVKLLTPQVLMEDNEDTPEREYRVSFVCWMPLSSETDIAVSTDWVVSIVEPVEMVKKSYEEKMNGKRNDATDGSASGGRGGNNNPSINLSEQVDFNQ